MNLLFAAVRAAAAVERRGDRLCDLDEIIVTGRLTDHPVAIWRVAKVEPL